MILLELYNPPIAGYQNIDDDNSTIHWKEVRKSKLTLRQIRRLRKMLDIRNAEHYTYLKKIHDQYGSPSQQPGI